MIGRFLDTFGLLIDGQLVAGDLASDVINPATEEVVASCPRASRAQLDLAVAAARSAFMTWRETSLQQRQQMLIAIGQRLEDHADTLGRLLTQEQGKPLNAARQEILGSARYFRFFGRLDLPVTILSGGEDRYVEAHRCPLGVVGAIVPWNFPLLLLSFKLPPALLAGNTIVVKPAATTPLTTLKFGELIADLVPPGVVNIIADENDLGEAMINHPGVDKISFTGSTATGKKVMAGAAATLKRVTLELGGNDAAIVLGDIEPKKVAPKLFDFAFANGGQVCIAIKRLYVHESVYNEICDELAACAEASIIGDGLKQGTQFGPLQNKAQFEKVKGLIEEASSQGRIVAGGVPPMSKGYFIRPTIVRDIQDGTRLVDEEQFGPVLPVIRFSDPEDAVRRANASPYGLGASIWSTDTKRAYELAKKMDVGTVWINSHLTLSPDVPFGGAKQSGTGIELGELGLKEFTQLKVISAAV